jgi:hypothetical protein
VSSKSDRFWAHRKKNPSGADAGYRHGGRRGWLAATG